VHGRRKDFFQGISGFFPKFSRGPEVVKFVFLPLETSETAFLLKFSNPYPLPTRFVTSLGHQGRRRVFWEGPNFLNYMSNSFELCPTHFFKGGEQFFRWGFHPRVTGLLPTPMLACRKKFVPHHLKVGVISSVLTPF